MKLAEVFAKPKGKINWRVKNDNAWTGIFSVGDREFYFMATRRGVDDSELHPYEDKIDKNDVYAISFAQVDRDPNRKGPKYQTDITGGGKPIDVFNGALVGLQQFIKAVKPRFIQFAAKEPSRMKLYKIMVRKLAGGMGFKLLKTTPGNFLLWNKKSGKAPKELFI